MPRSRWVLVGACALAVSLGCRDEPPAQVPEVGDVLPLLPLPPDATGVSRSGSADALQLTITSAAPDADMVSYYRSIFAEEPWVLISDTRAPDGAQVLYAEANDRPIWVRIQRTAGADGSTVQLSGALAATVDSARRDSPARQ